jgi:hypothetical protein
MATRDWDKVLVDTSAWIDFFYKKEPVHKVVGDLLDEERICCAGIIVGELLRGAKSEKELAVIKEFIHVFDFLPETHQLWEQAGELSFALRQKSRKVGLADCVIAVLSKAHNAAIVTLDKHFQLIKAEIKIDLIELCK